MKLASGALALLVLAACADDPSSGGSINAIATFGEVGRVPGQLVFPRAMSVEGDRLIVVDKTARIQRFDARSGAFIDGVRTPMLDLGKPTGLCVAPHPADASRTALYVADTHYHRVLVYDLPEAEPFSRDQIDPQPSEPLLSFGSYGDAVGEFIYPTDVAILEAPGGGISRVYVSEYGGNDRITVFEPVEREGKLAFEPAFVIGWFGNADEAEGPTDVVFNRPQSITIDPVAGELIVADSCNHRLARLTLEGELIAWIGGLGTDLGSFTYPYGLALVEGGGALVCEFGGCRVQHIDLQTGESLGSFGAPGFGEGTLAKPWGVAVAGGRAWVLDSGRNRVVGYDAPRARAQAGGAHGG